MVLERMARPDKLVCGFCQESFVNHISAKAGAGPARGMVEFGFGTNACCYSSCSNSCQCRLHALLQLGSRSLASSIRSRPAPRPAPTRHPAPQPSAAAAGDAQQPLAPVPAQQNGEWTPVLHEQTGLTYYWNERTGETTALGEPRPGPEGRVQASRQQPARVVAGGLGQLVAMGAGVGLVFALLSRLF